MTRPYPGVDTLPPSSAYPANVYQMAFSGVEFVMPDTWPKSICRVQFTILDPSDYKGAQYTEGFFLGTDDDPEARDPRTWASNNDCKKLGDLVRKAGIVQSADIEFDLEQCVVQQKQVLGKMSLTTKTKDGNTFDNNKISKWYSPGEIVAGANSTSSGTPGQQTVAVPVAIPAATSTPPPAVTQTVEAVPPPVAAPPPAQAPPPPVPAAAPPAANPAPAAPPVGPPV